MNETSAACLWDPRNRDGTPPAYTMQYKHGSTGRVRCNKCRRVNKARFVTVLIIRDRTPWVEKATPTLGACASPSFGQCSAHHQLSNRPNRRKPMALSALSSREAGVQAVARRTYDGS